MSSKVGVIVSFHQGKHHGIIDLPTTPPSKYFFWDDDVAEGEPFTGAIVVFDSSPRPAVPGRLPFAENIAVLPRGSEKMPGAELLAAINKIQNARAGVASTLERVRGVQ